MKPPHHCFHPVRVVTRSGKEILAPCGKCEACQLLRSKSIAARIRDTCEDYKYVGFYTLTYSNDYVPYLLIDKGVNKAVRVYFGSDKKGNRNYSHSHYCPGTCSFVPSGVLDLPDVRKAFHGAKKLHNHPANTRNQYAVGFCWSYDVGLCMRRFNSKLKYILKNECPLFKYTVSAEYGPTTFRPHYHLLIYTNSREVSRQIFPVLCQSWPYGAVRTSQKHGEFVVGDAARYVASYCCLPTHLPRVLSEMRAFKPFIHSSNGIGLCEEKRKALFESVVNLQFEKTEHDPKTNELLSVPLSTKDISYFFRKCSAYGVHSPSTLFSLYFGCLPVENLFGGEFSHYENSRRGVSIIRPIRIKYECFSKDFLYRWIKENYLRYDAVKSILFSLKKIYVDIVLPDKICVYEKVFLSYPYFDATGTFRHDYDLLTTHHRNRFSLPERRVYRFLHDFVCRCRDAGVPVFPGSEYYDTYFWHYWHPSTLSARRLAQKVCEAYHLTPEQYMWYMDCSFRHLERQKLKVFYENQLEDIEMFGERASCRWYPLSINHKSLSNVSRLPVHVGQFIEPWLYDDDIHTLVFEDSPLQDFYINSVLDECEERTKTSKYNETVLGINFNS